MARTTLRFFYPPTAAAARHIALAILATAILDGSSRAEAHSILPAADAIPPITFAEAYGEAAGRAADQVQPGEAPAQTRARLESSGECPYYIERVLGLASLKGSFGGPFRNRAPSAIHHLTRADAFGDVSSGRLACHLANEIARYHLKHRGTACATDGGFALEGEGRSVRGIVRNYADCRQRGREVRRCLGNALSAAGGEKRATRMRLLTRLGDVEASEDRWDVARPVWQAAETRGELGAYERARFGIPAEKPDGAAINPTIYTIVAAAAGGYPLARGPDVPPTMPWWPWDATTRAAERDARSGDVVRMVHYATVRIGEHRTKMDPPWLALRCTGDTTGGVAIPADIQNAGWKRPYCELTLDDPKVATHFGEQRWGTHGIETVAWLLLVAERTSRLRDLLGWSMRDHAWAHRHAEALLAPLWRQRSPAWRAKVLARAHELDAEIPYRSWRRALFDPEARITIQRTRSGAG